MTLLVLGGTGEARQLARRLADLRVGAILSLAGATRQPMPQALPTRTGGFGSEGEFLKFLKNNNIHAVLDATHPFAHRITDRTARVCKEHGILYAQLLRPEWTPVEGDKWTMITQEKEAAEHVPQTSTVFLATGRQTLAEFSNLEGCRVICRQIDPPDGPFPFEGGEFLVGRPPFSVQQEMDLFDELEVDVLVVKNAGGAASYTKLEAARNLSIPVLMIRRPEMPNATRLETVEEALAWVNMQ